MYQTSDRRGLTLIELLIAALLVSVLLGAVWIVYNTGFRVFYGQWTRSGIKGEAGNLLINMSSQLRQAASVTESLTRSVTFTADLDSDGLDETVRYIWSGTAGDSLNRVFTDPPPVVSPPVTTMSVLSSVKNIIFTYYDASNNSTTTASAVRLVYMDIEVDSGDETFRMRTAARLRNL